MKAFFLLLFITISCNAIAQQRLFIRTYNKAGIKIGNGRVNKITDSTVEFMHNRKALRIDSIAYIRTRHSFGHYIGLGPVIGFGSLALLALSFTDNNNGGLNLFTPQEVAMFLGIFVGIPAGIVGGSIGSLISNPKKIIINGDAKLLKDIETNFEKKQMSKQYLLAN